MILTGGICPVPNKGLNVNAFLSGLALARELVAALAEVVNTVAKAVELDATPTEDVEGIPNTN